MSLGLRSIIGALTLGLALAGAAAPSPAAAQTAPVSQAGGFANAYGLLVDVTALTAVPVDLGPVAEVTQYCPPQEQEPAQDTVLDVTVPTVVSSQTLSSIAQTDCSVPKAMAESQTEGAAVLTTGTEPATVSLLTADLIRARAMADCTDLVGEVEFVNLKITNPSDPTQLIEVPVTPPPNTRIDIPGVATIILNEQVPTEDGRGILVNAVHIIGASDLLRGDIVISHALAGVACPNGAGPAVPEGLEPPAIVFDKDASPTTARPGDTVTYNVTITNRGEEPCDVLRFVDHLNPVFEFVSTSGVFGDAPETVERADGGSEVVLSPTDVIIEPGASVTQQVVVRIRADVAAGTYFNTVEMFCSQQGDFASGPVAPVTVPAAIVEAPAPAPVAAPAQLPRTGGAPLLVLGALLLLGGGLGVRRTLRS